jgi:hypothetical protein
VVPFYHQRRLPAAKINPSLTMLGDEEGVIVRQIRTFQMDQSLENRIRERAYEIWTAHGCVHGQADQHWLAAEREILAVVTIPLARNSAPEKKKRQSPHPCEDFQDAKGCQPNVVPPAADRCRACASPPRRGTQDPQVPIRLAHSKLTLAGSSAPFYSQASEGLGMGRLLVRI